MSTRSDAERRLRAANMLPPTSDKPEAAWSSSALLERIEEKAAGVETKKRPAPSLAPNLDRPPRRARLVAAAALAILVPALLLAVFFTGSTDEDDVATTPPPTTPVQPIETDAGDVPFFARINTDEIFHDEDWGVIVFYRSPNCLPPNVNLLDISDSTTASDCGPPTVEGVSTWENGPDIDPAPLATQFTGLGEVPVWFVPWPLLERVTADGELTRLDLLAMQTRVEGTASTYQEKVDSDRLQLAGSGELADGGPFSFSISSDRSVSDASVNLPLNLEPVRTEDLVGTWENRFLRFEFAQDGSLTIIGTATNEAFGTAGWPIGTVSEATFDVISSVITITESTTTYCGEVRGGTALDPVRDQTGEYFAHISGDGLLVFDGITNICHRFPAEPARAPLTDPLTRVE